MNAKLVRALDEEISYRRSRPAELVAKQYNAGVLATLERVRGMVQTKPTLPATSESLYDPQNHGFESGSGERCLKCGQSEDAHALGV